jgi:ETC complex I subunit conserved region
MTARIYKPAKTAMQSGTAKTKEWVLDYEPEQPREIEPLMGWTSSGDMRQQVQLRFDTPEEAIAYCERHGIAYQVFEHSPRHAAAYPMRITSLQIAAIPGRTESTCRYAYIAIKRRRL